MCSDGDPPQGRRSGSARRTRFRHMGILACGALGLACLTPIAAAQTTRFTFSGRGWGHGVGLSQYGAQADAQHGWSAPKILGWYYRGTQLTTVSTGTTIRVLMASDQRQVTFGVHGSGELIDATTGHVVPLSAGVAYSARAAGAGVVVTGTDGALVYRASAGVRIARTESGWVIFSSHAYRGQLIVTPSGGLLNVVNRLGVESYVQGVVAEEMSSSWAPSALEAQAIAARSYALAGRHPTRAFDVYPDTRSQVYGGIGAETAATNAAVSATAGTVVTYHGAIIDATYFSSSGGHTENSANVWGGGQVPYLVGVLDPYETSPDDPWPHSASFTAAQLGNALRLGAPVASIVVTKRGVSPRAMMTRVTLTNGSVVNVSGNTLQADLGLMSTWFSVTRTPPPGTPATGRPSATVSVPLKQIAAFVVTHYSYANWSRVAPRLAVLAARNPTGIAAALAHGASARVGPGQVAAWIASHYAPIDRASVARIIMTLPETRRVQVLAQSVFPGRLGPWASLPRAVRPGYTPQRISGRWWEVLA